MGAGVCPGSCLCAVAVAVEGLQMRSELKLQLRREEKFNGDSEFGGVPVRATWQRGVVAEVVPEPLVPIQARASRLWSPSGLLATVLRVTPSVSQRQVGAQGLLPAPKWLGTAH